MTTVRTHSSLNSLLEQLQTESDGDKKQKLQERLWSEGTPLITQENGKYQVTFLYKSSDVKEVELFCPDFYDRLLDENDQPRKFKKIPGTDTYTLQLDNVPADTFAAYNIVVNNDHDNLIADQGNKKSFLLHKYDTETRETTHHPTSYIQLPEARVPAWMTMQPPLEITRSITEEKFGKFRILLLPDGAPIPSSIPDDAILFKLVANQLTTYKMIGDEVARDKTLDLPQAKIAEISSYFLRTGEQPKEISKTPKNQEFFDNISLTSGYLGERDIFVYKPEGWDNINPADRKVMFMLEGKYFCNSLTPYIDAMRSNENNQFSNTAIVFINPGTYSIGPPGRVIEDYFKKDDFARILGEQILPAYCEKLGINNNDNVTLAAHSLAAYPVLETALQYTDQIGGVILMSPALNQNMRVELPEKPDDRLAKLPIYMQIGQLEDTRPSKKVQEEKDMKDESRLEANQYFHQELTSGGYLINKNHEGKVVTFTSGHSEIHAIDGLSAGLKYIHDCQEKNILSLSQFSNKITGITITNSNSNEYCIMKFTDSLTENDRTQLKELLSEYYTSNNKVSCAVRSNNFNIQFDDKEKSANFINELKITFKDKVDIYLHNQSDTQQLSQAKDSDTPGYTTKR